MLAQEPGQFEQAKAYYQKALQIKEAAGDDYGAANDYHNLGVLAQEQQQFEQAKAHYQKAFEILQKCQDWYKASLTLSKLIKVLAAQENETELLRICIKVLAIDVDCLPRRHCWGTGITT